MCKFKSAIILKDRVYIPDCDSHQDILDRTRYGFELEDMGVLRSI